ncbi:MAG TPA: hypothetical protein VJ834_00365 [Burkholderiales bacterium]|nr:hypothetical protein [Burkholderiales bacterium]
MPIEDRIENLYLKVWRAVVLCVATAALAAAVFASAAAINGLLVEPPHPPAELKPEEGDETLRQTLTLQRFSLAERGASPPWPTDNPGPRSDGEAATDETLRRIAHNIDKYVKAAFPPSSPVPQSTEWAISYLMKRIEFKNDAERRFYLTTLESLSEQLARAGPEQAQLPEERRIDAHRVLRWHAENVQHALNGVHYENEKLQKAYQQRVSDYTNRNTRIIGYISVAVGALAIFVFSIFLFVIIRIERDLRTMAIASVATTRRLES